MSPLCVWLQMMCRGRKEGTGTRAIRHFTRECKRSSEGNAAGAIRRVEESWQRADLEEGSAEEGGRKVIGHVLTTEHIPGQLSQNRAAC